jgi:hypothetical protein
MNNVLALQKLSADTNGRVKAVEGEVADGSQEVRAESENDWGHGHGHGRSHVSLLLCH